MAIDQRISLGVQPPQSVGSIFQNALTNIGLAQGLEQQRQQAPFQNQLLQLQTELAQAQQPAMLQQAQQAANPLSQVTGQQQQMLQLATISAQNLKPAFDSNSRVGVISGLTALRDQLTTAGAPPQQIAEIEADIAQANTPEGFEALRQENQRFLQQVSGQQPTVQASQFIPGVGFATLTKTGEAELVPVAGVGETVEQKRQADIEKAAEIERQKQVTQGKSEAIKLAVKKGGEVFDRLEPISTAINNYDEAIAAIDAGAETGVIDNFLPSFREASVKLENVKKRLGLDVVGNTTFGALSESELQFALDSALPTKLQPQQLKEWLIAKRDAQKKTRERLEEAAQFLSSGENTVKDWIQYDKARQLNFANQRSQAKTQQPSQPAEVPELLARPNVTQVGRFTVEVVD